MGIYNKFLDIDDSYLQYKSEVTHKLLISYSSFHQSIVRDNIKK